MENIIIKIKELITTWETIVKENENNAILHKGAAEGGKLILKLFEEPVENSEEKKEEV